MSTERQRNVQRDEAAREMEKWYPIVGSYTTRAEADRVELLRLVRTLSDLEMSDDGFSSIARSVCGLPITVVKHMIAAIQVAVARSEDEAPGLGSYGVDRVWAMTTCSCGWRTFRKPNERSSTCRRTMRASILCKIVLGIAGEDFSNAQPCCEAGCDNCSSGR